MPADDRKEQPTNPSTRAKSSELNLPKREEGIVEFWERDQIFEKTLAKTLRLVRQAHRKQAQGKPERRFVFYEGPPTANGSPGIHHFEARAFKDVITRYKTMRGFFVERKAGWDTHGLPVEIQVEKELGLKTKKDIEKFGIGKFNAACRESVWRYKEEWERFTKRIGYWLDLEHPYITYETSYIESLWWIIKEIWKRGLFYQDFKVVPWCPRCQTGLSTHEVGQGYRTVQDRSVYVRFRLQSDDTRWSRAAILSWTTTPWTLPGNVALAVRPEEEYVCIPDPDERGRWVILGKKNFDLMVAKKLFPFAYQNKLMLDDIDVFKGSELVGLAYEPLFFVKELQTKTAYHIYPADFVTMDDGTGIVHTAVMYGEDDYQLGARVGLPKFHTVTESGEFIAGIEDGLAGLRVKDPKTEEKIIASLKARGLLFGEEPYEHEYPHCWRCETPLLYYAREGWWVKMSSLRKELVSSNKKINWVPEHLRDGRFGEFVGEARDWAFSRERYWGTPLPVWQCTSCKRQEVVGSLDDLHQLAATSGNRYWVMRHGGSETQLTGVVSSSRTGFHLTPDGEKQVRKQIPALKKFNITRIIASPLARTKETAVLVGEALGVPVETDERFAEINVGIFEGRPNEEYEDYFPAAGDYFSQSVPEGESLVQVRSRVAGAMRKIDEQHRGERILIVSHADPIWMLWQAASGVSDAEALAAHPEEEDFLETAAYKELTWKYLPRDETGAVNLHRPFVDEVLLSCPACKKEMRRVPEVADVWFDSGAMPFAQYHFPFAFEKQKSETRNQKLAELPYPADYICEAIDQTRGWFYTLLAVATLLGREAPYRNVISLGHVLDKNGQKMSKSKGNVVSPWDMIGKYGTDAIRWYFFTINAPGDTKRFDERDLLLRLRGTISTFWNSFVFFDTYVAATRDSGAALGARTHPLDQWALARFEDVSRNVAERLDAYDVVGAARLIDAFIVEDLSNWYIRRSRRRLQKPATNQEREEAAATLGDLLVGIAELLAPFMPFLSEVVYRELRGKLGLAEESVHLRDWPTPKRADAKKAESLLIEMQLVRDLAAAALALRAKAGIKVRQPLSELKVKTSALKTPELMLLLRDEVNVKSVRVDPAMKEDILLDTHITKELAEEGFLREFIRNIQEMRRDGGFRPQDQVGLTISGDDGISALLKTWEADLKSEAGIATVQYGGKQGSDVTREVLHDGKSIAVGIRRI